MIAKNNSPVSPEKEQEESECHLVPIFSDSGAPNTEETRKKQIAAMALRGPEKAPSSNSWRNTVGKYDESSPLNVILNRGQEIREAERENR